MRFILKNTFIWCFSLLFLSGCFKSYLYISGDKSAVEAEIYIDDHKVGLMKKNVYVGSTSTVSTVVEREKKQQQQLRLKSGDIFSGAEVKVSSGNHELKLINKEGKLLTKKIKIQGENYIAVDFEKMIIKGGE